MEHEEILKMMVDNFWNKTWNEFLVEWKHYPTDGTTRKK